MIMKRPHKEIIAVSCDDSIDLFKNGLSITISTKIDKFIVYKREFWVEQVAKCKAILYN